MVTITLRPSEVPSYLRDSDFYRSLNIDDDEEFSISFSHWKENTSIYSNDDFCRLLSTMRFWGLSSMPVTIIDFLVAHSMDATWPKEFEDAFPLLVTAREVRESSKKVSTAARSESFDYFAKMIKRRVNLTHDALSEAAAYGRLANLAHAHDILEKSQPNALRSPLVWIPGLGISYSDKFEIDTKTCAAAAGNGHLDCLKYLHENGFTWNSDTTTAAIAGGHRDCLEYAHRNGCYVDRDDAVLAAAGGHLGCLQYLHANSLTVRNQVLICTAAAGSGHLDCLQYAHENGFPGSSNTMKAALEQGHLDCVVYMHDNRCTWPDNAAAIAAESGHLDCLAYALNVLGTRSPHVAVAACKGGNVDCLRYAVEHECGLSFEAFTVTARKGYSNQHLVHEGILYSAFEAAVREKRWECLRFLLTNIHQDPAIAVKLALQCDSVVALRVIRECGLALPADITSTAMRHDSIACLQHLYQESLLQWDESSAIEAVENYASAAFEFAVEYGCPRSAQLATAVAGRFFVEHLAYLHKHGCPFDSSACTAVAGRRNLDSLQFLHMVGCSWDASACAAAAESCSLKALKYLHRKGCPWDKNTLIQAAIQCSRFRIEETIWCLLTWPGEHGTPCPWSLQAARAYAYNSPYVKSLLQDARQHDCRFDRRVVSHVTAKMHFGERPEASEGFECLKFASERGCPWSVEAARALARGTTLQYLQYAHEHGCPWDESVSTAAQHNASMLAYCVKNGCPITAETMKIYNRNKAARRKFLAGESARYQTVAG